VALIDLKYGKSSVKLSLDDDHIVAKLMPKGMKPLTHPQNVIKDVLRYPMGTLQLSETISEGDKVDLIVHDMPKKCKDIIVKGITNEIEALNAKVSTGGAKTIVIETSGVNRIPKKPEKYDIYVEVLLDFAGRPCAMLAGKYEDIRSEFDEVISDAVTVDIPTKADMVIASTGEGIDEPSDIIRAIKNSVIALDNGGTLIFLSSRIKNKDKVDVKDILGDKHIIWVPMDTNNLAEALNKVEELKPSYVMPNAFRTVPKLQ
jgi:hypothetical protein